MKTTLGLFLLAVICAAGVYAQSEAGYGAVTGTVRDANGEGIPDQHGAPLERIHGHPAQHHVDRRRHLRRALAHAARGYSLK